MIIPNEKTKLLDFDDYGRNNHNNHLIEEIHKLNPKIKINMFAIPIHCQDGWVQHIREKYPFVTFCMHGYQHGYNYECKEWTGGQTRYYLSLAEKMGFDKVFKAPGWQISDVVRNAVLDMDWILVDRFMNYPPKQPPQNLKEAISPTAKILLADEGRDGFSNGEWYIHGHVQDIPNADPRYSNGMPQMHARGAFAEFSQDTEWEFIKDLFK